MKENSTSLLIRKFIVFAVFLMLAFSAIYGIIVGLLIPGNVLDIGIDSAAVFSRRVIAIDLFTYFLCVLSFVDGFLCLLCFLYPFFFSFFNIIFVRLCYSLGTADKLKTALFCFIFLICVSSLVFLCNRSIHFSFYDFSGRLTYLNKNIRHFKIKSLGVLISAFFIAFLSYFACILICGS